MQQAEPVVNLTASTSLSGKILHDADDGLPSVYGFLGVPYAEPPVGVLRFCDPRPLTLWEGIRDAKEFGAVCPQNFELLKQLPFHVPKPETVSEDCLFLNIWTPSVDSAARLPVMFWIHGGGFITGFTNLYCGRKLAASKDVVVVSINYRVGSLGFLCINDSSATGNYGILDQIEALKWVQKYIVNFGGDPNNVTIFGESAGGMSVSLLVISPLTRGLFRRAIAESGSVFGGDLISCPPEKAAKVFLANAAKKFPDEISSSATPGEIVEFLRRLPVDDLVAIGDDYLVVIDGRVLPSTPLDIYASASQNHVELMVGCNNDEGHLVFVGMIDKFGVKPDSLDVATTRLMITSFLAVYFTFPNAEKVAEAVITEYMGDVDSTTSKEDLKKILVEFFGDVLFVIPTIRTADYHSRTDKTYVYNFCYRPSFAWYPDWMTADHGTEVFIILDIPDLPSKLSAEDKAMSRQMKSYWVNFAKTGNPNGEGLVAWPEYNEVSKQFITLRLESKADSGLKGQRADFWLRQVPSIAQS